MLVIIIATGAAALAGFCAGYLLRKIEKILRQGKAKGQR